MPIPTTNATQELPAVNQILASVGQAPVTTLDQTNPDVVIAYDTLLEVNKEVQAEGWTFNKEFEYTIVSEEESDLQKGKISVQSPIGKGLLGKKKGEEVIIEVPSGELKLKILNISL